jgi:hypothetical protein
MRAWPPEARRRRRKRQRLGLLPTIGYTICAKSMPPLFSKPGARFDTLRIEIASIAARTLSP